MPALIPDIVPESEPIVATAVFVLVQVPPGVPSVADIVNPVQTEFGLTTAAGVTFTVRTDVVVQPAVVVYVIVVVPAETPDILPISAPIVATAVLLLLQLPPTGVEVSVTVKP